MQRQEELQEIETMGEEDLENEEVRQNSGFGTVPLLQAALCALILAALVFLKYMDREKYDTAVQWYQKEAVQEIELPQWSRENSEPVPAPESTPAAPSHTPLDGAPLQKV